MTKRIKPVELEELVEVTAATLITETHDLGVAVVHVGIHPTLGAITLVSTFGEKHAIVEHA